MPKSISDISGDSFLQDGMFCFSTLVKTDWNLRIYNSEHIGHVVRMLFLDTEVNG